MRAKVLDEIFSMLAEPTEDFYRRMYRNAILDSNRGLTSYFTIEVPGTQVKYLRLSSSEMLAYDGILLIKNMPYIRYPPAGILRKLYESSLGIQREWHNFRRG